MRQYLTCVSIYKKCLLFGVFYRLRVITSPHWPPLAHLAAPHTPTQTNAQGFLRTFFSADSSATSALMRPVINFSLAFVAIMLRAGARSCPGYLSGGAYTHTLCLRACSEHHLHRLAAPSIRPKSASTSPRLHAKPHKGGRPLEADKRSRAVACMLCSQSPRDPRQTSTSHKQLPPSPPLQPYKSMPAGSRQPGALAVTRQSRGAYRYRGLMMILSEPGVMTWPVFCSFHRKNRKNTATTTT